MNEPDALRKQLEQRLDPYQLRILALSRYGPSDIELAAVLGVRTVDGVQAHKRAIRIALGGVPWREAVDLHRRAGLAAEEPLKPTTTTKS